MGPRADLFKITELFERGLLKPVVDRGFPLEKAQEAHTYLEGSRHFGKVVLRGDLGEERDKFKKEGKMDIEMLAEKLKELIVCERRYGNRPLQGGCGPRVRELFKEGVDVVMDHVGSQTFLEERGVFETWWKVCLFWNYHWL